MKGNKLAKANLGKMTLGEQDLWEKLAGCSLMEIPEKGLTGRRLAALLYIFAKRENPEEKFEDFLELDMDAATDLLADDIDPKAVKN